MILSVNEAYVTDTGDIPSDLGAIPPDYNLTAYDPLNDAVLCSRHIPFMMELKTNIIRTYSIDPSQNHSACMTQLGKAGIYVLVDLVAPGLIISITNPVWNKVLYDRFASVIDTMQRYPNLLGFIIGDDAAGGVSTYQSGPYVKAAVRDMKAYIENKHYRYIPVGYVHTISSTPGVTGNSTPEVILSYLNCGETSETVDFLGLKYVGVEIGTKPSYSVPQFIASYPLMGDDILIPTLFGEMSRAWSGVLIYQFVSSYPHTYGKSKGLYQSDRLTFQVSWILIHTIH